MTQEKNKVTLDITKESDGSYSVKLFVMLFEDEKAAHKCAEWIKNVILENALDVEDLEVQ